MKAAILGTGFLALSVMPSVFASDGGGAIDSDGSQRIPVSLAEAKAKCMELTANQQMRPFTIKVECNRERTFWLEEKNSLRLPNSFSFSGRALIKNLYEIKAERPLDESLMMVKECPRFAEYRQKMEAWQLVDIPDCKALNAINELASHCKGVLGTDTNLTEGKPELTGRVIDTCNVQLPTQSPGQQSGQTPGQSQGQLTGGQQPGQQGGGGQGGYDISSSAHSVLSNFGAQLAPKTISTQAGTIVGLEVRGRINLNSLAGRLGLSERDVVTHVNGAPVAQASDLATVLGQAQSGNKIVKMTLWRATTSRWTFVEVRL